MLAQIESSTIYGIDAYQVSIEVDIRQGLPGVVVVGLPDTAIKESRERVKSAVQNSGYKHPLERITINLAPADIRKEGAIFDLPIALGILIASRQMQVQKDTSKGIVIIGELALDGTVRPVKGALPVALGAKSRGIDTIMLPEANTLEAALVSEMDVVPVATLVDAAKFLEGTAQLEPVKLGLQELFEEHAQYPVDFSEVKSQYHVKRALEVAVAGSHNIIMIGPPGSGKTMLAKRISTIIPHMTLEEALETTKIHSIVGLLPADTPLVAQRPFRSPHHTISDIGLIGGGNYPRPGEVSLAHNGVLFLDETPEFHRNALEVLRQPLENGEVSISRAAGSLTFPARIMLVAAMNPCPCGFFTDPKRECRCTPIQIQRYMSRISGPLLDRIDIHIEVPAVRYKELAEKGESESSEAIRERVNRARERQQERFHDNGILCNAHMTARDIKKHCLLDEEGEELLRMAIEEMGLSARAYDRIRKVSRTIADLEDSSAITASHVSEAIQYRTLDRNLWM